MQEEKTCGTNGFKLCHHPLLHKELEKMIAIQHWWRNVVTKIVRKSVLCQQTINYIGNNYEIRLLLKNNSIHLPESKFMAMQRMQCAGRTCRRNRMRTEYKHRGRHNSKTSSVVSSSLHYRKFQQTEQNKMVFDAAAKSKGMILTMLFYLVQICCSYW